MTRATSLPLLVRRRARAARPPRAARRPRHQRRRLPRLRRRRPDGRPLGGPHARRPRGIARHAGRRKKKEKQRANERNGKLSNNETKRRRETERFPVVETRCGAEGVGVLHRQQRWQRWRSNPSGEDVACERRGSFTAASHTVAAAPTRRSTCSSHRARLSRRRWSRARGGTPARGPSPRSVAPCPTARCS